MRSQACLDRVKQPFVRGIGYRCARYVDGLSVPQETSSCSFSSLSFEEQALLVFPLAAH